MSLKVPSALSMDVAFRSPNRRIVITCEQRVRSPPQRVHVL